MLTILLLIHMDDEF